MITKVPTKIKYYDLMEKLNHAVSAYKNCYFKDDEMKIYLSDGNVIETIFSKKHVAHLLGINFTNLNRAKILRGETSFELLEQLIEKSGCIYDKIERGEINFFDIFSKYIDDKIDAFYTILNFRIKNIAFAVNYLKERSYCTGEANNLGCEYYLALKNEEGNYVFWGFKPSANGYSYREYAPASILTANNKKKYDELLENLVKYQSITLVNNIAFGYNKKQFITADDKLLLLQELRIVSRKHTATIDVSGEYGYNLNKLSDNNDRQSNTLNILRSITLRIKEGKEISKETINYLDPDNAMDAQMIYLIEAYNLSIKYSKRENLGSQIDELNDTKKDLEELKDEVQRLRLKVLTKDSIIADNESTIENLEEQVKNLSEFYNDVSSLVLKNKGE